MHSVIDGHFLVFLSIMTQHNYVLRSTEKKPFSRIIERTITTGVTKSTLIPKVCFLIFKINSANFDRFM